MNIHILRSLLVVSALTFSTGVAGAIDNSDCFSCHEDKGLSKADAAGKTVSLYVDQAAYNASIHGSNQCVSCHADIKEAPHPDGFKAAPVSCSPCHKADVASYEASVHGQALKHGDHKAAACADCHGKHAIAPLRSPASPLHGANLGDTCGKCHPQVLQDVKDSIHGKAMAQGMRDAPTCTDCHSDHQIEALATASPMKIAEDVCSRCHSSERINTRYKLPGDKVSSFFESYHGLAAKLGSTRAANCASCHGYHKILPSSDPASTVNPNNMVKTCGKCHPGANANFVQGKIHQDQAPSPDIGNLINRWVRWIYLALIIGVIGGMLIHNLLTFAKKVMIARRHRGPTIVRMTFIQRIQHGLLLISFITLAITGFALKFPGGWAAFLVGSNETVRRTGHLAAATVLLAISAVHVAYLAFTVEGRKLLKDLLPSWQDVLDVIANIKYLLFPKADKPRFPRFTYGEKAEYWAVVWGTIIMGLTGIMIWLKMDFAKWLPRWVIDVATTIHFYEAILAVLAIIVWHLYHVIFDPDVYPNNTAWLDGKMPEELYRHEHERDEETLRQSSGNTTQEEK